MRNLLLFVLLLPLLLSCESQPSALSRSIQEYQNEQWLLSEMWAEKSIKKKQDVGQSQYMMGLCEFKRRRFDSAETWFTKASTSTNKEVHGKATAMLGIISEYEGDYAGASEAFAIAVKNLTGRDRLEANARASGTTTQATTSEKTFTLQFGAYRDKSNAATALAKLTPELQRVGLAPTWIIEDSNRWGRTLFLVQGGRFSTRTAASLRKGRGDLPQCNVAMID